MRFALSSLVALAAVCGTSAFLTESEYQESFVSFMSEHNKAYDSVEFFTRYNIFKANLDEINRHNSKPGESYKLGINQFTASTPEEFQQLLGYKAPQQSSVTILDSESEVQSVSANLPSLNWATTDNSQKRVTISPVKDQGNCGSCWAFSTTGAVEGVNAIKKGGNVTSLSEQQLVDCSTQNSGCNGGLMDYAFAYIIKNGGLASEAQYPYTYIKGQTNPKSVCKTNVTKVSTITKYTDVKANSADALETALNLGPVSVAVDATEFSKYKSGIFSGPCKTALNHGVLAVGYGEEGGKKFWIVKNSWGTTWGEKGYIRMERIAAAQGLCGIQMQASYPTA